MELQGIFAPWLVEILLISMRAVKNRQRPPLPGELAATFVVFGMLSFIPNKRVSAAAGWGFVVASALNVLPSFVSPQYNSQGNAPPGLKNVAPGTTNLQPAGGGGTYRQATGG